MSPLQVAFSLACIIIVIIGAYYATYYIGVKASGQTRGRLRNKNINIIDRFAISRDKGFYLMEIAGKVYVIGVTNQAMTLLDTLDAAAFEKAAPERQETSGYQAADRSGNLKGRLTNKLAAFMAAKMGKQMGTVRRQGGSAFADSLRDARDREAEYERTAYDRHARSGGNYARDGENTGDKDISGRQSRVQPDQSQADCIKAERRDGPEEG